MPRTTARGNVIKSTKKKKKSKSTANSTAAKALTSAVKNVNTHAATVAKASQATSTGSSSNTKSSGSSKMQGTTTFTAPTLSETIKNLSNAAKKGSAVQTPSSQKVSVPLFDHHQTTAQRGGSVLGSGDSSLYKGRTFVNPQGKTVAVNPAKNNADTKNQSNSAKGNTVSNAISSGHTGVRGTSVLQAPTLSETIKNLSDAAKEAKANEKTPTQKISSANVTALNNMSKKAGVKNDSTSGCSNILPTLFPTAESNYQSPAEQMADNAGYDTLGIHPSKGILSVQQSPVIKDTQTVKESAQAAFDKAVAWTAEDDRWAGSGAGGTPTAETQNGIDTVVNQWNFVPDDKKVGIAESIAYSSAKGDALKGETWDAIVDAYHHGSDQDKVDILLALEYKNGFAPELKELFANLTPQQRVLYIGSRASKFATNENGANNTANQISGNANLMGYTAAIRAQKEYDFLQEWGKEHYTAADVFGDTVERSFAGVGAAINDFLGMTAADIVTKDRELTAPWHGVDLLRNDLLTNLTAIGKNFINFFMYTAENSWDNTTHIFGHGNEAYNAIIKEMNDKIAEWGTSLGEGYRREAKQQLILADAADLSGTEKVVNNIIGYVTQMAPILAVSAVNPSAGMALLGTSAAGQYARQAYDSGASLSDSLNYGIMGGLLEAGTEKIFSGFGWFGKGIGNAVAEKTGKSILKPATIEVLNGFKKSGFGQALTYFVHSGAEASEEMVGQVLQSYLQRATYDPDAKNATLKDIAAAGGYGAVVSGLLGLPQTALGVTSAAADRASAKAYTNQMKEMAAVQISNIQKLVESKQITLAQAQSAIEHINNSVKKSIAKVSGSLAGASAASKTVKEALSAKTQQAVAKFQQSAFGKALSYFAAHGVTVSPAEAGLVVQAYLKDSSGENGSDLGITSTFGDQRSNGQSVDSAAANVGSSSKEGLTEDSPHVVSSQEEALAELRKVAATKKPGEWISVVKVDGKGAVKYTALVSSTHDIQQVQHGVADPATYKGLRGKNQVGNELKKASRGGILDAGGVGGTGGVVGDARIKGKRLTHKATSGVALVTTSGKTTTILGRYGSDTGAIIRELNIPKNTDFSVNPDAFNLLNVPDELYSKLGAEGFWNEYNQPFLDAAISRGDEILMATPITNSNLYLPGSTELTGYGKEYFYLVDHGYKYVGGKMILK